MKLVQGDAIPFERGLEYRGGTFHAQKLLEGEAGTPGNFSLVIGRNSGDFYSPRHRHNFDQMRYQLDGTLNFGRTGKMSPGMLGYFPEGVAYGPQTQRPEDTTLTLVLQCGGASGSGYLSSAQVTAGMAALQSQGAFQDGVFRRNPDLPGKRNLDAFRAIWEFVNGRPLVYPKPRYTHPVLMDPAHYDWVDIAGRLGVAEKLLGVFTERRSETRFLRLEPGAHFPVGGRGIYLVLSGDGTVAGENFRRFTTLHLDDEETARFSARGATEILHLGLPNLAKLRRSESAIAEAAE